MAKGRSDLIMRDRLQFTLDSSGNQTTVYGRFDLSDYVSTLERKGLSIKEVNLMLRSPDAGNTGTWYPSQADNTNVSNSAVQRGAMKVYATTRAYENAADVGIASPDVLHIEEWHAYLGPQPPAAGVPTSSYLFADHFAYPVENLHPDGFPVVTDLLIGVATDSWNFDQGKTLELDVMLIAEPITISQKQLTEMLVQGQDQ